LFLENPEHFISGIIDIIRIFNRPQGIPHSKPQKTTFVFIQHGLLFLILTTYALITQFIKFWKNMSITCQLYYVTQAKLKFSYGYFIMGKANRGAPMNNQYTAIIKKDGNWWIGWIEEVPGVNCQEKSRKELIASLKVTLKEALEFNL